MNFTKTSIEGVLVVEPEPKEDNRGYFERVFCKQELNDNNVNFSVVQINQTMSLKKGTIRGPHIQKPPYSEDKLVRCIKGKIFDVAVDVRKKSKTFGKWIGIELSEKNNKMLLVPKGFLHGFQALENNSIITYPVSQYYHPESVVGIRWDDPFFAIKWPIKKVFASKADATWPMYPKLFKSF